MKLTHDRENRATWDYGEVETALCLWEAVLDFRTIGFGKEKAGEDPGDTYRKLEQMFDGNGSFTMRAVIASIVPECDRAWQALIALNGGDPPSDMMAFDFDFCPRFIADALDNGILDQALTWQGTRDEDIRSPATPWAFPLDAPPVSPANSAAAPANLNSTPIASDPDTWFECVWDGLHAYREDLIPEGDEQYDAIWSDICTSMAWLKEALDAREAA